MRGSNPFLIASLTAWSIVPSVTNSSKCLSSVQKENLVLFFSVIAGKIAIKSFEPTLPLLIR